MGKIVGRIRKIWVMFCMLCVYFCDVQAEVLLSMRDTRGRSVKETYVGEPFVLEVTLDGDHSTARNPVINRLDKFSLSGRQTKIHTINGVTTVIYQYTVIANKPGTYEVGPAHIMHNGAKVASNSLTCIVANAQNNQDKKKQETDAVIMRLTADKKQVVVGEPVRCCLQLLCSDNSVEIKEIQQPLWGDDCTVEGPGDSIKRVEEIDGITYQSAEWVWYLYPTKTGRLVIPATATNFKVPVEDDDAFSRFSFFFSQRYKNKRVYSNALSIEVEPLPAYAGQVDGVGAFSHFTAELKPPVAKEGEGMVLTLSVAHTGKSNIKENLKLIGVPEGLQAYASKQYVTDQKNGTSIACFEYIIQGIKPGNWEIPAQAFTYFDIAAREYKTLHSQEIMATIFAPARSEHTEIVAAPQNQVLTDQVLNGQTLDELRPLHKNGWCHQTERVLPCWLFLLLILLPILVFMFLFLQKIWINRQRKHRPGKDKKEAFARARAAIKFAEKNRAYAQLYPILVQLFVDRLAMQATEVTEENSVQVLGDAGLAEKDLLAWRRFFASTQELVFASVRPEFIEGVDKQDIFKQAYDWLTILEKVI